MSVISIFHGSSSFICPNALRYVQELPFYGMTAISLIVFLIEATPRLTSWLKARRSNSDPLYRPLLADDSEQEDSIKYAEEIQQVNQVIRSYGSVPNAKKSEPVVVNDDSVKIITVVRSTAERLRISADLLFCSLQFVMSVYALHTPAIADEFINSNGLRAQALFWTYAFFLVLIRVAFIRASVSPKIGLWRNSTTLYLFAWMFTLINFRSALIHPFSPISKWFHIAQFLISSILFINNFSAKLGDKPAKLYSKGGLQPSTEPVTSLIDQVTFGWIDPLIWKGYFTSLQTSDLWDLREDDHAFAILQAFRAIKTSYGLTARMGIYFRSYLIISFFWAIVNAFLNFGPPFVMKQILEYIEDPTGKPKNLIWLCVFAMFFFGVLTNVSSGQSLFIGRRICIRIRAIIIGEVYAKALRRKTAAVKEKKLGNDTKKDSDDSAGESEKSDPESEGQSNQGSIINLMSVDTFKVSEVCGYLHFFVVGILTIIFCVYFLYTVLGWSAFVGSAVMVVLMPLNYWIGTVFAKYQNTIMQLTDERINKLNELLQSIRIVKYFAWEDKFAEGVKEVREKELAALKTRYLTWALSSGIWFLSPLLITSISFGTFCLVQGRTLTAPIAFTSLALFNIMRSPMDMLTDMLNSCLQGKVSIDRIEEFLKEAETSKYEQLENTARGPNSPVVGFENATFSWMSSNETVNMESDFKLRDINVAFKVGELNVVVGPTGSGKSSLLMALLGEMELTEGRVFLPSARNRLNVFPDTRTGYAETVAYCAQQAWLLNDTIRNNIIFASEFNEARYNAVIDACSLRRDLQILDAGDATEIGEKGITLSGGQKQRVSLARAIYSNSKHLLLDDCLSAVDSHTALAIYEEALTGPLCAGRTVILISHNVALTISQAAQVIVMDNGRITAQGLPAELAARGLLGNEELVNSSAAASTSATRVPSSVNLAKQASEPAASLLDDKIATIDSSSTDASDNEEGRQKTDGKLIVEETKAEGRVKTEVYVFYMSMIGGVAFWLTLLGFFIGVEWINIGQSYWLRIWTSKMVGPVQATVSLLSKPSMDHSMPSLAYSSILVPKGNSTEDFIRIASEQTQADTLYYLGVYSLIGVVLAVVNIFRNLLTFNGSIYASREGFNRLLESVLHSKVRFFDSTPLGRIMNRFSKDIESLDQSMAPLFVGTFQSILGALSISLLISMVTPGFLIAGIFIGGLYWAIGSFYLTSSRELKRLDSISKSPIFQHFGETLNGISTIRAYGLADRFIVENLTKVDNNNIPFFYMWVANRWLSFRIDFAGALVSFSAAAMVILSMDRLDAGLAGLSLSYAITFSENVLWIIRLYAGLEMNLNSVERLQEYMDLDQEAADPVQHVPLVNWPSKGEIVVKDLSLRYAPELPLVIKNVSFKVDSFNKIGIVGRTGAGKSTIITAFFRFLEADSGSISIDGIDIASLGLKELRENLAIIPQDPTLFIGTIRSNLDPFNQYSDAAIFEALRRVNLLNADEDVEDNASTENVNKFKNLDNLITEGGANLSQGQRQLICLARSLLKSPKVLLLDEATASIDYESDAQIQQTIREEFGQTTILTIAHRLKSIADYDKILVMDQGQAVEYDAPHVLLSNKDTIFYSMCAKSGELNTLLEIAEKAYKK